MDTYGYVRVSTKEQNEDRQVIAMRDFGVEDSRIVLDKQSGKDFEHPGCRRLVRKQKPGILSSLRASTGWDGTAMKSRISGGC